ncbi:MAG: hypothetical protein WCV67_06915 [Victivallaceae bacterium]
MIEDADNSYTFQGKLISILPWNNHLLSVEFDPTIKPADINFEFKYRVVALNARRKIIQDKNYNVTNELIGFYVGSTNSSDASLIIRNFMIQPEAKFVKIIFYIKNNPDNLFARTETLKIFYSPEFGPTILLLELVTFVIFSILLFILIKIICRTERRSLSG